jgi:hypothetical protein
MEDPLDREIDLGTRPEQNDVEHQGIRWRIVAVFLVCAVLTALFVGFLLRSPRPASVAEKAREVDSTVVDLPPDSPASPSAPPERAEPRRDKPLAPAGRAPAAPLAPVAPTAHARVAPHVGRLLIRSSPADADVFVNGVARGKTPLALRELAPGSYTIRVARSGYIAEERTLHVTASQPSASTMIDLRSADVPRGTSASSAATDTAAGGLNVQSRPAGARVYVDDRLAGSTPISIPRLPAGPATVRIEMDGYRLWTTKVLVKPGEQIRVAASLERR